jgi:hypothetical protein
MERRIFCCSEPTTWLGEEEWQQSVLLSVNGTIIQRRGGWSSGSARAAQLREVGHNFWGFPVPTASTTSMQLHFDGEGVGTCLFFFCGPPATFFRWRDLLPTANIQMKRVPLTAGNDWDAWPVTWDGALHRDRLEIRSTYIEACLPVCLSMCIRPGFHLPWHSAAAAVGPSERGSVHMTIHPSKES